MYLKTKILKLKLKKKEYRNRKQQMTTPDNLGSFELPGFFSTVQETSMGAYMVGSGTHSHSKTATPQQKKKNIITTTPPRKKIQTNWKSFVKFFCLFFFC